MIGEVAWPVVVLLGLVCAGGALTQSVAGFGLAVVTAPVVVMLAPDLMPGALLVPSLALPFVELTRGQRDIDGRSLGWAMLGRLLLLPVGIALVALTSPTVIAVLVGVMVLVAVGASVWMVDLRPRPASAFGAGMLTGVTGTAAAIGGPFLGLVLQHERPSRVRSTLAAFFVLGASVSLIGLAAVGELTQDQVRVGLVWVPFVAAGAVLSIPVRRRLAPERMRKCVLVVAAVAGVSVLVRAALG
ncbi:sulfite exporter TauE/SafE family protein [Luteipulveratus mongoliensis]|uniref:Probable membrane transporter protein n=1 Tax=Luteipulveratus mongoliensis TaxID=571913 RepID=A0A0K1JJU6_9MICO|nr:sulfite exporter TauE/SafE family protein [Luteipulveratus mongoliensis]AKU16845.1 hypothetical protein VV02_14825 [Luteipulveratus mongoliensis]